ncbi:MAG: gamma-glutamyl-phosphate reductase, partial [Acidobacteriota bacterium]|nr:gamma-glutamyl-phosphate reductase [Acidobacteriota bacterium]
MATTTSTGSIPQICRAARTAARELPTLSSSVRDAALHAIADALVARTDEILAANARDLAAGEANGLSDALMD